MQYNFMKKFLIYAVILIAFVFVGFYFSDFSKVSVLELNDLSARVKATSTKNIIRKVENKISALSPILSGEDYLNSNLSNVGILNETNESRKENGHLPPLSQNSKLDRIASLRIKDMFKNGYFEHKSPTGIGASDVAYDVGYEFILIGENIALGNFQDDKSLVQAWMNSPGHRANILNNRYVEIGISAEKGLYKGEKKWLAVQIFGRPLSLCGGLDKIMKKTIEESENAISLLDIKAKAHYFEINSIKNAGIKNANEYNEKVREYNGVIDRIKNKESEIKNLIENYNNQIRIFNECVKD